MVLAKLHYSLQSKYVYMVISLLVIKQQVSIICVKFIT